MSLKGVLLPFTTPFAADESVDLEALRANLSRWNTSGVAGYVALGSTGERVHLDARERAAVVETAREAVQRELAFVVGVGEHGTRGTIEECKLAARQGADAVLVLTPHFYKGAMTQPALASHFEAVADSSHAPVVLYNIPQNTGVALAPETVARLSEHTNIAGIKDSSGDVANFVEMIRLVGGRGRRDTRRGLRAASTLRRDLRGRARERTRTRARVTTSPRSRSARRHRRLRHRRPQVRARSARLHRGHRARASRVSRRGSATRDSAAA